MSEFYPSPEKNITQPLESEEELQQLLSLLPKDLASRLEKETNDLDLGEAIAHVRTFWEKRNKAKQEIFTHIHTIENEEIKKEVLAVISSIEQTYGNRDYYLGEGTVGKVYRTPYAPHVCIKYIYADDMFVRHGNTVREEIDYLEDLDGFSCEGIRVPQVYFDHASDKVVCFGMETIEGKSLDQIIADPESCEFIELIRKQDLKDVLARMKVFIEKLHNEKKLVHRDLATRNIMIDTSGSWWVIDFGKAKRIEIGDDSTQMSEATDFPSAENAIRKLFAKIQQ